MIRNSFLTTLINDIVAFKKYLQNLMVKVYPYESLSSLLEDDILYITDAILEILFETSGEITPEVSLIVDIWASNFLQKIAHSINNAELKNYPFEIINVYRDLIIDIEDEGLVIATVPEDMFASNQIMFSFQPLWKMLDVIYNNLIKIDILRPKISRKIIKLSYPKEFKNDIFIAGIYAHEIGHYFERSRGLRDKILLEEEKFSFFRDEIIPYLKKINENDKPAKINDAEYIPAISHLINSWVGEIFLI